MTAAQVWSPIRKVLNSDLSNRMVQLKAEETGGASGGAFSTRCMQHLSSVPMDVQVHSYVKPEDLQPLYEKRIREFLEDVFRQFDLLTDLVAAACTMAARRLSEQLKVDLSVV